MLSWSGFCALAVALSTTVAAPAYAQSNLPPDVQAKILEADAGDALKAGDFPLALKKLEDYRKLGIAMPPAMMYLEARAALAANDLLRSKRVFEEYFNAGGSGDPNFNDALNLYRQITPAVAASIAKTVPTDWTTYRDVERNFTLDYPGLAESLPAPNVQRMAYSCRFTRVWI